jgi:hypothetical protein
MTGLSARSGGGGTGTTVTTDSSPWNPAGFVVKRGSLFAAAMLAIIRSATRPRLPGCLCVEGQRAERRFYALDADGSPRAFGCVGSCVDSGGELREADGADREFGRQVAGRQPLQEYQDARVAGSPEVAGAHCSLIGAPLVLSAVE